eukprot:36888-Prorocentrum_lima.AAC.1
MLMSTIPSSCFGRFGGLADTSTGLDPEDPAAWKFAADPAVSVAGAVAVVAAATAVVEAAVAPGSFL